MSILSSDISTNDVRQTSLNLYDQGNKLELFQLKAYIDKAEINSSHNINISCKQLNIMNLDGKEVSDIATTISNINNEIYIQKGRIDSILDGTGIDDQIKKVVDFFKDLDETRLVQIDTLQNNLNELAHVVSVLVQKFAVTFES